MRGDLLHARQCLLPPDQGQGQPTRAAPPVERQINNHDTQTTESVVSKRQADRSHPTWSQSSASPTDPLEPRILASRSSTLIFNGVYLADSTGCRNTPPDPTRNDLPRRQRHIPTPGIPSPSEGSPVHSTCCDHQRRNTMSVQNTSRLRLRRNSPLMNHAECSDRCQDARNQEPQMRVDVAV